MDVGKFRALFFDSLQIGLTSGIADVGMLAYGEQTARCKWVVWKRTVFSVSVMFSVV